MPYTIKTGIMKYKDPVTGDYVGIDALEDPIGVKPIVFSLDNVSNVSGSYTHSTTISGVTSTMKPIALELGNPAAFLGNITVTCENGSITLSCPSVEGTSTATVTVEELAQNPNETLLTSEEFTILNGRIGTLANLQTTEKGSLVGAINEVNQKPNDVQVNGTSVVTDGVANIPVMGSSVLGVATVPFGGTKGIDINSSNELRTRASSSSGIKSGTDTYCPIVPYFQHESTFYGLAKAAGDTTQKTSSNTVGVYTDTAKTQIQKMLGVYHEWEEITNVTTTENLATVDVLIDSNGQGFELSEMYARAELPAPLTGTQDYVSAYAVIKRTDDAIGYRSLPTLRYSSGSAKLFPVYHAEIICGIIESYARQGTTYQSTQTQQGISTTETNAVSITGFRFAQYSTGTLIPSGTKISIYGKRK